MDISNLQFRNKNPRLIKDENLEKLKKSIKDDPDFLTKRKILVNDTKDGMIVYAGNQRLRSLIALGYTEIPDEWVDIEKNIPLKLMEKRAFKDNVEYGEYDHDKLKDFDLEFLKELDLPEGELDLSELNDIELDEDKENNIPEPAKEAKIIEIGDIIQLGPHRIMCGDSTDVNNIELLMDGAKADMVLTDPPYGMHLDTDWTAIDGGNYKRVEGDGDDFNPDFITTPLTVFSYCDEIFLRGADYYAEHLLPYKNEGAWLCWDNGNPDNMLGSMFELCWSKAKHKRTLIRIGRAGSYGLHKDDVRRIHPTQKPRVLSEWFIDAYMKKKGGVIVDLYSGGGGTLLACEAKGMISYNMEYDAQYVEAIIKRYHEYTKGAREIKCLNRDLDLTQLYAQ